MFEFYLLFRRPGGWVKSNADGVGRLPCCFPPKIASKFTEMYTSALWFSCNCAIVRVFSNTASKFRIHRIPSRDSSSWWACRRKRWACFLLHFGLAAPCLVLLAAKGSLQFKTCVWFRVFAKTPMKLSWFPEVSRIFDAVTMHEFIRYWYRSLKVLAHGRKTAWTSWTRIGNLMPLWNNDSAGLGEMTINNEFIFDKWNSYGMNSPGTFRHHLVETKQCNITCNR